MVLPRAPAAGSPPAWAAAGEALRWAERRLRGKVDSPGVDAEVLVRHVLGWSRAELFAHAGRRLAPAEAQRLARLVARRRAGEPLQYLTGSQAFRGLELVVGPGVLVPRPETEVLVEHALRLLEGVPGPVVVDVGTGSGAIALSIAAERPDARVWATELSTEALRWARRNRERAGAGNVTLLAGDLFAPLPPALWGAVDLVAANPPYLAEAQVESMAPDVRDHEPRVATVSGPTGLEVPGRVVAGAWEWLRPGGWLVMETWPGQAPDLRALLETEGYLEGAVLPDLAGSDRFAIARRGV